MRAKIVAAAVVSTHSYVLAMDAPVVWRDPDSGCAYWLTPQGGIAPRFRRDGVPDCPDVQATGLPLISDQSLRDAPPENSGRVWMLSKARPTALVSGSDDEVAAQACVASEQNA